MTVRLSDEDRAERARTVAASALAALRAGDPAEASQLLAHAVHDGVQPYELAVELITQAGGRL